MELLQLRWGWPPYCKRLESRTCWIATMFLQDGGPVDPIWTMVPPWQGVKGTIIVHQNHIKGKKISTSGKKILSLREVMGQSSSRYNIPLKIYPDSSKILDPTWTPPHSPLEKTERNPLFISNQPSPRQGIRWACRDKRSKETKHPSRYLVHNGHGSQWS